MTEWFPGLPVDALAADLADAPELRAAFEAVVQEAIDTQFELPILPPAAVLANVGAEAAWFAANGSVADRFTVERPRTVSRVRMGCGVASGNIEVGIYAVTRVGNNTFDLTRICTTGVIPCPAPASNIIEVNFTAPALLRPGQYALYLWCDNTTATFAHTLSNTINRAGWALNPGSHAGGMPVSAAGISYGGRAFAATVEAAIPTRLAASLLGDSITQNQQWFSMANGAIGTPFTATNFGAAGETSTQIAARVGAALAGPPKILTVLAGTNDVGGSTAAATVIDKLTSIYAAARAAGAKIVAGTIPPRNATPDQTPLSAGQVSVLNAVNTWIRSQAAADLKVADWTVQLSTGNGVTPNLTYFTDHVHPNAAGQVVMAGVLDDILATI